MITKTFAVALVAESSTPGTRVHVLIDAIDQKGSKGKNLSDSSRPYPWDVVRETPFTHTFLIGPGIVLSVSMRVYTLGAKGGWVGCYVKRNGVVVPGSEIRKAVTGPNSSAVCLYTGRVSKS